MALSSQKRQRGAAQERWPALLDSQVQQASEKSDEKQAGEACAVSFDGTRYTYRSLVFTVQEAGVYPSCPLDRIQAMVDATLADEKRREEIRRYGRRLWHSIVRPERAASQALDYAFGHDVQLCARFLPYVSHLFEANPVRADAWTLELRRAYVASLSSAASRETLYRLLREAGVPAELLVRER